ncbi:Phosphatidylinositol 4-kinase type 2 [Aphelenchoides besseyi]|nr:Phosphatidylinositol 4-kinase type 2 [Aphelenchoides besseyi]
MAEVEVLNPTIETEPIAPEAKCKSDLIAPLAEKLDEKQQIRLLSSTPAPMDEKVDIKIRLLINVSFRLLLLRPVLNQSITRRSAFRQLARELPQETDFNVNLNAAREAISHGVYPERIPSGSSGSYFVSDVNGRKLAVFKPANEEPFAENNPKWPKFFQRILSPCCFGRACLIPNNGYLSECAASIVDDNLKLNIVPKTRVVKLESPTFFYGHHCGRRVKQKPKEGSFQLFVHDYRSAAELLPEWNTSGISNVLNEQEMEEFTLLFHKMCVLDYVIRNTDRHMDNYLIKLLDCIEFQSPPWNEELSDHLLNLITPLFLHNLCQELSTLFRHGVNNRVLVARQLRVFRGQVWNLIESLREGESPSEMVKRVPILVKRKHGNMPPTSADWNEWYRFKPASCILIFFVLDCIFLILLGIGTAVAFLLLIPKQRRAHQEADDRESKLKKLRKQLDEQTEEIDECKKQTKQIKRKLQSNSPTKESKATKNVQSPVFHFTSYVSLARHADGSVSVQHEKPQTTSVAKQKDSNQSSSPKKEDVSFFRFA